MAKKGGAVMSRTFASAIMATSWERALNHARTTVGKKYIDKEPSDVWKRKMLLSEHSPIRVVEYDISIQNIRQWVTTHLVRHWLGFIPFVHTQREERRELPCRRDDLPQGSLNDMDISANAQALINVSRKRKCMKASKETREAWAAVCEAIKKVDPIMESKMVPECVYRGFCPEFGDGCGYSKTEAYKEHIKKYRSIEQ